MEGQRALITGGGSGIGLRLAERFAQAGARVALCDSNPAAIARMHADRPEIIARQADVTDETEMAAFLADVEAQWGGVDVVCDIDRKSVV